MVPTRPPRIPGLAGGDANGNVRVLNQQVAFGAKDSQTLKALQEAESYPGPSVIIDSNFT